MDKILPTNNIVPLPDHAAKYLKHMPSHVLNSIKSTLLYDKTPVKLPTGTNDRRSNGADAALRVNTNLVERAKTFTQAELFKKKYYRLPLKLLQNWVM